MFYYKVVRDDELIGYAQLLDECLFPTHIQITQEEFEAAIAEDEEQEQEETIDIQQMVVEEQAKLLTLRANPEGLSTEDAAYIENRLDAISDYWDSKEGQVATYGTY
jgi:hypothetical protein